MMSSKRPLKGPEEDQAYRLSPVDPPRPTESPPIEALPEKVSSRRWRRMPVSVLYVLGGLALAPVFTLTPYLQIVGWVLSAVIHEAGHTLFGLAVGSPALPAISLQGHAQTIIGTPILLWSLIVWGTLVWLAWLLFNYFSTKWLQAAAISIPLIYPLLAFHGPTRLAVTLLSGHLCELIVGGIFLWRARTGLFTEDGIERLLYACLGWYLIFSNAYLCYGIAFDKSIRTWYSTSGSFDQTNDYIRVARDALNLSLNTVVLSMLGAAVAAAVIPFLVSTNGRHR
ncbi:MAG: hypothetical protein N2C12_01750, partial [Planctomycetales bacterium]